MDKLQIVKKCHVCSDKASSFHYNGLTCASCKMFFRRNVHRFKEFECQYSGTCELNKHSRRCCLKCRLDKCFSIGMKTEMIESQQCTPKDQGENIKLENAKNDHKNQNFDPIGASKFIENAIRKYNQSIEINHSDLLQYDLDIKIPKSIDRNRLELNLSELKYIDELRRITSSIFNFDEPKLPILYEETNSDGALDLAVCYIVRIVKYCQANAIFRSMPMAEQMLLLKQFIFDFIIIRYAYVYDCKRKAYLTIADQQGKKAVLTKLSVFQGFTLIQKNQTTTLQLSAQMEKDYVIRDLVDFSITNLESMRYEYWTCHRLLLQYLQCKHQSIEKGQAKYVKLMTIISEFRDGKEAARLMFMKQQEQHESVRHVALEIFDIGSDY